TADPSAHRPVVGRPGEMAEPHHRRVDPLLRPVLPDRARSPPESHQHLPEALGWAKVQTTADPQTLQQVVDRTAPTTARPIRPLEHGPLLRLIRSPRCRETVTPGSEGAGGCNAPGHPTHAEAQAAAAVDMIRALSDAGKRIASVLQRI